MDKWAKLQDVVLKHETTKKHFVISEGDGKQRFVIIKSYSQIDVDLCSIYKI